MTQSRDTASDPLDDKLVDVYMQTGSKAAASRAVGVRRQQSQRFDRKYVQDLIAERRAALLEQGTIDALDIMNALAEIAMTSIADFVNDAGNVDLVAIRDAGLGHLIKDIRITERTSKDGVTTRQVNVTGYSRLEALKALTKILGMNIEPSKNPRDRHLFDDEQTARAAIQKLVDQGWTEQKAREAILARFPKAQLPEVLDEPETMAETAEESVETE